jgi:F0F1-type ATP synthase membrane subunit b/b'
MKGFNALFTGFFGLILVILFLSVIIMWFCAPVLLYMIYQKLSSIEEKLKK